MSDGSNSAPLLLTSQFSANTVVEYWANFVSDFDFVASCFGGTKLFIAASGYMGSTSLKISHPCRLPL
jgi:hypothetical protein